MDEELSIFRVELESDYVRQSGNQTSKIVEIIRRIHVRAERTLSNVLANILDHNLYFCPLQEHFSFPLPQHWSII